MKEKINVMQAIKYPIGTIFEVIGNIQYIEIKETNFEEDGDIPIKKLVWEDGHTVFATDYELGLELIVLKEGTGIIEDDIHR